MRKHFDKMFSRQPESGLEGDLSTAVLELGVVIFPIFQHPAQQSHDMPFRLAMAGGGAVLSTY